MEPLTLLNQQECEDLKQAYEYMFAAVKLNQFCIMYPIQKRIRPGVFESESKLGDVKIMVEVYSEPVWEGWVKFATLLDFSQGTKEESSEFIIQGDKDDSPTEY